MILDLLFLLLQLMAGALVASDDVSLTRGIINFGDRCSLGLLQANGKSGTEVESLTALSLFDSGFIFLSFFRRVGFSFKSLPSSSVESTIASFFDSFFTLLEMDSSSLLSVQSSLGTRPFRINRKGSGISSIKQLYQWNLNYVTFSRVNW